MLRCIALLMADDEAEERARKRRRLALPLFIQSTLRAEATRLDSFQESFDEAISAAAKIRHRSIRNFWPTLMINQCNHQCDLNKKIVATVDFTLPRRALSKSDFKETYDSLLVQTQLHAQLQAIPSEVTRIFKQLTAEFVHGDSTTNVDPLLAELQERLEKEKTLLKQLMAPRGQQPKSATDADQTSPFASLLSTLTVEGAVDRQTQTRLVPFLKAFTLYFQCNDDATRSTIDTEAYHDATIRALIDRAHRELSTSDIATQLSVCVEDMLLSHVAARVVLLAELLQLEPDLTPEQYLQAQMSSAGQTWLIACAEAIEAADMGIWSFADHVLDALASPLQGSLHTAPVLELNRIGGIDGKNQLPSDISVEFQPIHDALSDNKARLLVIINGYSSRADSCGLIFPPGQSLASSISNSVKALIHGSRWTIDLDLVCAQTHAQPEDSSSVERSDPTDSQLTQTNSQPLEYLQRFLTLDDDCASVVTQYSPQLRDPHSLDAVLAALPTVLAAEPSAAPSKLLEQAIIRSLDQHRAPADDLTSFEPTEPGLAPPEAAPAAPEATPRKDVP